MFISKEVNDLTPCLKIKKAGEYAYAEVATGIPPHVMQTSVMEEVREKVNGLVPEFQTVVVKELDSRTFNGVISETRMKEMMMCTTEGLHCEL